MGAGTKFDGDKIRLDLILPEFIEALGVVLTQGAEVHGDHNWKDVDEAERRYYAAIFRHLIKYKKGQTIDDDSGQSHLAHVAANAMFLLWFEQHSHTMSNKTKKEAVESLGKVVENVSHDGELAKPDIQSLIGKTGMFWDGQYNENNPVTWGEFQYLDRDHYVYYPFKEGYSYYYENFYLTNDRNEDLTNLDPNRLYTRSDIKELT